MANAEWFDTFIEEHLPALLRTAVHLCDGRRSDAEDLVQDTVLRALRGQDQLRQRELARPWLFRILTTTHLNRLRSRRRRAESFATDLDDEAFEEALGNWHPLSDPEVAALSRVDHTFLAAAIAALPPNYRTVLLLADAEGFTQRQVASILGVSEGTVASRLYRARAAMRSRLQPLMDERQSREAV